MLGIILLLKRLLRSRVKLKGNGLNQMQVPICLQMLQTILVGATSRNKSDAFINYSFFLSQYK